MFRTHFRIIFELFILLTHFYFNIKSNTIRKRASILSQSKNIIKSTLNNCFSVLIDNLELIMCICNTRFS